MTPAIRRCAVSLGLAALLAVGGCSSSGKKGDSSGPATTAPQTAAVPLGAAAKREITRAFTIFFDTDTSLGASVKVLQHGKLFRKTLAAESKSPSAKDITAKVSRVRRHSHRVALVTFTIFSGTSTLLPNTKGFAVRDHGTWKVAAQTFCSLLRLEGTAPDACEDSAITKLPG